MFRIVGAAVHQPVDSRGGIGRDSLVVDFAGLHHGGRGGSWREMQRQCNSYSDQNQRKTQDSPRLHARPLSKSKCAAPVIKEGFSRCGSARITGCHVRCATEGKSNACRTMEGSGVQ